MNNQYVTITQMNNYIRMIFDENIHLKKVFLRGEISNFKHHSSGHLYLTLKDEESRISAIMFRSSAERLAFTPEDGMNVLVEGRISVYPAGGNYQIYIDKMIPDGLGNLYLEYEKLKKKLQAEGLFDINHKRELPKFPTRIGVVTAPTGAAIHDIMSTIERRFPIAQVILFPALVQGASAKDDIASKIQMAQNYDIDVLIVGRGGGSIEDMWAFNEEIVARAIYESRVPVISAVGHEVDFTIADFVADKRAPTPTGAAEMAVSTLTEVHELFSEKEMACSNAFQRELTNYKNILKKLSEHYILKNPMTLYEIKIQKLDNTIDILNQNIKNYLSNQQSNLMKYKEHYLLKNPYSIYMDKKEYIEHQIILLNHNYKNILNNKDHDLQYTIQTLKLVNPLNILDKGYSLVKANNHIVKDSDKLKVHDELQIVFYHGEIKAEVKEIIK